MGKAPEAPEFPFCCRSLQKKKKNTHTQHYGPVAHISHCCCCSPPNHLGPKRTKVINMFRLIWFRVIHGGGGGGVAFRFRAMPTFFTTFFHLLEYRPNAVLLWNYVYICSLVNIFSIHRLNREHDMQIMSMTCVFLKK